MSNIGLLFACLILGVLLRASGKLLDNAPATINGFITNVALPALVLAYIHGADPKLELIGAVVMPWILFLIGAAVFWSLAHVLHFSRSTTGALMMVGGLG
jgi:malate permease and related proteins